MSSNEKDTPTRPQVAPPEENSSPTRKLEPWEETRLEVERYRRGQFTLADAAAIVGERAAQDYYDDIVTISGYMLLLQGKRDFFEQEGQAQ